MAQPVCLTCFHKRTDAQCLFKKARVPGSVLWLQEMEDSGLLSHGGGQTLRSKGPFLEDLLSNQVLCAVNHNRVRRGLFLEYFL